MRFYIMSDMEGASGVVDFDTYCSPEGTNYEKGRRLATLEVNAAIEGILDTGNHEVVVCDGHGCGALDIELLHKEALLIAGRPLNLLFEMDRGRYDGFFMVGQHAMKGAPGAHLDHTFDHNNILSLTLNGQLLGEAAVNSLRAGLFDIPTLFLSGDGAACAEIQSIIPDIETCTVKWGITTTAALFVQPKKARELIRKKAAFAVSKAQKVKPFRMAPPFEAVFEFANSVAPDPYRDKDYCQMISERKVLIRSDNLEELLVRRLWGL